MQFLSQDFTTSAFDSWAVHLQGQLSLRERLMFCEHRDRVEISALDASITPALLEGFRVPLGRHEPNAATFRPADGSPETPLPCAVVHDTSGQAWLEIFA
jgi:hypothetical protein